MEIRVGGYKIDKFEQARVSQRYDCVGDTFTFILYFNSDLPAHKKIFRPGTYQECVISHGNQRIITGTILNVSLSSSASKELSSLSGYSITGVLADNSVFTGTVTGHIVDGTDNSLQFDGLSLREIANKLISRYALADCVVDKEVQEECDMIFSSTNAEPTDTVEKYLADLAAQRNVVMSHTIDGKLLFTKCKAEKINVMVLEPAFISPTPVSRNLVGSPEIIGLGNRAEAVNASAIYRFQPGQTSWTKMSLNFNGQQMHSYIQCVGQQGTVLQSPDANIRNAYVNGVFRFQRVIQTSGDNNDTARAAQTARSNDLSNIKLVIEMPSLLLGGKVIAPNQIIEVVNPELYLYKPSRWFVESVDLYEDETKDTATLTCVVPETYNDEDPVVNVFAQ